MSIAEILLVIAGLSINVFLISQKDGAMIRRIRPVSLLMLCAFFFVFESLSMFAGFRLTRITFFRNSSSTDLKKFCYFCAVVLFLIIAAYMLFKAFTEQEIDEHLTEISVTRTICIHLRHRVGLYRPQYLPGNRCSGGSDRYRGFFRDLYGIQGWLQIQKRVFHSRRFLPSVRRG